MSKEQIQDVPAEQLELQLPYEAVTGIANRNTIREVSIAGRQSAYVDIDLIQVRGGYSQASSFNPRFLPEGMTEEQWHEELEIKDFALNDLWPNGHLDPLQGFFTPDGTIFYLVDGFRRLLGMKWLLSEGFTEYKNGKLIRNVEVMQIPKDWNEEDMVVRSLTTDSSKLKYKPIEVALKLAFWKKTWKRTNEYLAGRSGKSRQWVDNMMELAEQPQSIRNAIATGKLGHTAALELANSIPDANKREEIVQNSIDNNSPIGVKEAKALKGTENPYANYKELMKAVHDQYMEEVINLDLAVQKLSEIAEKAEEAKADDKSSIKFAHDTVLKWINDTTPGTTPADYTKFDQMMDATVAIFKKNLLSAEDAITQCNDIAAEATDQLPEQTDSIDQYVKFSIQQIKEYKPGPIKIETQAAHDADDNSRITSSRHKDHIPQNDTGDALDAIDYRKDKELGEFELNEILKLLDKHIVQLDSLPKAMAQQQKDWQGLMAFVQTKVKTVTEILKKAADKR